MKKTIIAVAFLMATSMASAANNPEDWRVSYASVMDHYKAGRYSQVLAELPRLGLTGAEIDRAYDAIKGGTVWTDSGDFDKWKAGNGNGNGESGNGNGGNGNGNGQNAKDWSPEIKAGDDATLTKANDYTDGKVQDQAGTDAKQNDHINAVQDAAQTANDRATNLEGRADQTETAIRETNTQLEVTDGRSIDNATRLDGVEQVNTRQDGQIAGNTAAIGQEVKDRIQGDADTLKSANSHTDGAVKEQANKQAVIDTEQDGRIAGNTAAIGQEVKDRKQGDADTLKSANTHADGAVKQQATKQAVIDTDQDGRIAGNTTAIHNEGVARAAGDASTLKSANEYTDRRISQQDRRIDDNQKEARAGIAGAMAMSQIPQVGRYGSFSVGAGVGQYRDQQAVAVGASARIGERVITKMAFSADSADGFGVGAGIGVEW